jgi:hypothetical protein
MKTTNENIPTAISHWDGVEELVGHLAQAGFKMPEWTWGFSAEVAGASREEWRDYVKMCGREFVRCGGQVDREKEAMGRYDRVYRELIYNDEVRMRFVEGRTRLMDSEPIRDAELEEGWSDRAKHLRVVAQRVAKVRGGRVTKKGFELQGGAGFCLQVEVDVGRPGSTRKQVIMYKRLVTDDGRWGMWLPWSWVLTVPEFYLNGETSTQLTWNIRAQVEASLAFMETLRVRKIA